MAISSSPRSRTSPTWTTTVSPPTHSGLTASPPSPRTPAMESARRAWTMSPWTSPSATTRPGAVTRRGVGRGRSLLAAGGVGGGRRAQGGDDPTKGRGASARGDGDALRAAERRRGERSSRAAQHRFSPPESRSHCRPSRRRDKTIARADSGESSGASLRLRGAVESPRAVSNSVEESRTPSRGSREMYPPLDRRGGE